MKGIFDSGSFVLGGDIQFYDQESFYRKFEKDLFFAQSKVIIESPFITRKRIHSLLPTIVKLTNHGVSVIVNTRNPEGHDEEYRLQALDAVGILQSLGVSVLYTVKHHRKLAIIDDRLIWNGSLNILSQNDSCEIMWRVDSVEVTAQLLGFINVKAYTRS